jgi:3',5'-cyclic AMP phosphodiesterase CpdA
MKRLAHLSDVHFKPGTADLITSLEEDLDEFNPDLLVVTGDLTERARPDEFEQARGFLDGLPFARLVVPGSHDIAPPYRPLARLFNPYGRYTRYFPPTLNSFFVDDQMLVIGINTVHPLRWKLGNVTAGQLDWVEQLVQRYPDKFHVLAAHHPLLHVSGRVTRYEPLLTTLERIGIDLVLTGHLPEGRSQRESQTEEPIAGRTFGVAEAVLVAQAEGGGTSRMQRGGNAYNRVTVGGTSVHIERRSYDDGRFVGAGVGNYERRAGHWRSLVLEASGPFVASV